MSAAAIVLCGGRSTRMGRAKAWLPWRGQPMVAHVVASLRAGGAVDEVIVVTSEELDLPPLEGRLVRDRAPTLGPWQASAKASRA
jgi:molybdopterin-guanine dinucleotide biosynthesis protein A